MYQFIIINADDFGITRGVNKAIFELADLGSISSTSVMSNMPDYEEIIYLKNKIGIGVHLNLTEGKPVTDPRIVPSIINEYGKFYSLYELIRSLKLKKVKMRDIEVELDAQIARLIDLGIQPDHINSHESFLKYPFFNRLLKKVADKFKIKSIRIFSPRKFDYSRLLSIRKITISLYLEIMKLKWKYQGFYLVDKHESIIKLGHDFSSVLKDLKDILQQLPYGVLELVVHPGYCKGDISSLGDYTFEREAELKALSNDEFRQLLVGSGINLISYKDLIEI